MPSVGPLELAIIAVILLVLFGAKRIPELGRSMGTGARDLKQALTVGEKKARPDVNDGEEKTAKTKGTP